MLCLTFLEMVVKYRKLLYSLKLNVVSGSHISTIERMVGNIIHSGKRKKKFYKEKVGSVYSIAKCLRCPIPTGKHIKNSIKIC